MFSSNVRNINCKIRCEVNESTDEPISNDDNLHVNNEIINKFMVTLTSSKTKKSTLLLLGHVRYIFTIKEKEREE
jgi:hypothetical protein